jgi:hypothetical protein
MYSSSSARFVGFLDEISKIAEAQRQPTNKERLKKFVKNTLLIAAGTGVGTGLGTIADELGRRYFGQKYKALSPKTQSIIVGAITAASALATNNFMSERMRAEGHK